MYSSSAIPDFSNEAKFTPCSFLICFNKYSKIWLSKLSPPSLLSPSIAKVSKGLSETFKIDVSNVPPPISTIKSFWLVSSSNP